MFSWSGASMGYQIGTGLGGGLSPLIATSLTASHGDTWAISLYIMLLGALIAICTLAMQETAWIKTQRSKSAAAIDRLDKSRSSEHLDTDTEVLAAQVVRGITTMGKLAQRAESGHPTDSSGCSEASRVGASDPNLEPRSTAHRRNGNGVQ
jgi:hypothetical protein